MEKNKQKKLFDGIVYFLTVVSICIAILFYTEQISRPWFHLIAIIDIAAFILLYFFGYGKMKHTKISYRQFIVYSVFIAIFFIGFCILYALTHVGLFTTLSSLFLLLFLYSILLGEYKKNKA